MTIENILFRDLDLHFQGQTFQVAILTNKGLKLQALLLPSDRYLPANGATANAVHDHLDLHFEFTNFET